MRFEVGFRLLWEEAERRGAIINKLLEREVEQHQFDAILSLNYNVGTKPTKEIINDINEGNIRIAGNRFLLYIRVKNHTTGLYEESEGIEKRRDKERKMFRNGDYGDIGRYSLYDGDPRKVKAKQEYFPTEEEMQSYRKFTP